jgi:hypothetical protein
MIHKPTETMKRIKGETKLKRFYKKLFFIIFGVFFLTVFLIDLKNYYTEKQVILQLLDIQKTLYISLIHIKRSEVDAQMGPILKHFGNVQTKNS